MRTKRKKALAELKSKTNMGLDTEHCRTMSDTLTIQDLREGSRLKCTYYSRLNQQSDDEKVTE